MLPFPSYYYGLESNLSSGSNSNGYNFIHGGLSSTSSSMEIMMMDGSTTNTGLLGTSSSTISSRSTAADSKALAACKSHSEAERRRRERINGHLATLRTLLPNTIKTDKASLLAEVVQHVKELKKVASEITAAKDGDGCRTEWWPFPRETDELTLGYCEQQADDELLSSSSSSSLLIRVSLSCDDRPDLMADLTQALRSVGAKVVKAEIATVGGRTKSVLVIQPSSGCGGGGGGGSGGERRNDYQDLGSGSRSLSMIF
ncbi:ACT domain [Macleaya cordata]|uniref:ACT domain n=1 Tax=Macleaya cordata TaxID=56857 RepID=A0A200PUB0_MACCD|nr:ACT domain [Macleaya cordata]